MSLYSALYAGVSGLGANSSAIAGVADNITNINTVGYKGVDSQFRTLVTSGENSGSYVSGGVAAASRQLVSKQGLLQISSSETDLGIDGSGFFVTSTSVDGQGQTAFTRAGSFLPDDEGYLRNSGGYYLQGWRLDSVGDYINDGSVNSLEPVRLLDLAGTAAPTTQVNVRANLQASTEVYAGAYAAGDIASGSVQPQFTRSIEIYDAQGAGHTMNLSVVKTAPNVWSAEVHVIPATDVAQADGLLASGDIVFNPDGSLNIGASSPALFAEFTPTWTSQAGSQPISLNLGSDGAINGMTQFGAESALISSQADGGLLGNLSNIQVDDEGVVSAVFEDGTTRAFFQLPIATFPNPDGLTRLPGNAYRTSNGSGDYVLNEPGILGSGSIAPSSLEGSNVDLASEFSSMIRFQRAYSASSKIITTVDEMLQEVSNLKR